MRRALLLATALMSPSFAMAAAPTTCPAGITSSGQFGTLNGTIYDANQQPFVARGIAIIHGNGGSDPTAAQILAAFPGTNFVRLSLYNYDSPASLAAQIKDYTSHGIVTELKNTDNQAGNAGGGVGPVFTGALLARESNWYASLATAFKDNPKVWFATDNEPNSGDKVALANWQMATYQAIRGTGNNAPIMIEVAGGDDPKTFGAGIDNAVYSKMTNVIAEIHIYGWLTKKNTDQATNDAFVKAAIATTQANFKSAAGTPPVIIGEYGNSTDGKVVDKNGTQIVAAVGKSGVGTVAWAWGNPTGKPGGGDALGIGDGYGAQVAGIIKKAATATASAPSSGCPALPSQITVTTPTTPTVTPDILTLPDPAANTPPPSTLSSDPPPTGYVPWYPQGQPANTPHASIDPSMPVTPSAPPIQAQVNLVTGTPPDPLDQASWWADNPVARAAEAALCGSSENSGADLWMKYCGVAN